jgi:hypothetical protein
VLVLVLEAVTSGSAAAVSCSASGTGMLVARLEGMLDMAEDDSTRG